MDLPSLNSIILITILASSTTTALAVGSYLYLRTQVGMKQQRARLERHLRRLQRLTSQLLNACDCLLEGDSPEQSALYHRFKTHGGEYYGDICAEVRKTLRRGQGALQAAFALRQKLIDPAVQQHRSLEQQIWDWEMLYAALVGQGERIQNLTAEELRSLFSRGMVIIPMLL
ncbi:MAG: hypothetical protein JW953_09850 [Anaerolineae bacterium]|nr:hypothetical protein [Anaerolineae bacterium]